MRKLLSILALSCCVTACIYPYTPELDEAPEGVLSVDASIVIGDVSTVQLGTLLSLWPNENARTSNLGSASVWLEDDAGDRYPGKRDGFVFEIPTENAPGDRRYRLCIEALGAKYTSDWNTLLEPPVIRDVQFQADEATVTVAVSVDGGGSATGYLLLSYDEAWEFHVDYVPKYEVSFMQGPLPELDIWDITETASDYSKYWCWKTYVNLGSAPVDYTSMSSPGITNWPLIRFARTDNRNHRQYCVNVKARSISKETYRFLKNLEDLSSGGDNLFTPTPGEIAGNLHCESDPERMVLGYALFSQAVTRRAWLDSRYLLYTPPYELVYPEQKAYRNYYKSGYLPLVFKDNPGEGEGPYGWGPRYCYDCTGAGGTLTKPDFWDE